MVRSLLRLLPVLAVLIPGCDKEPQRLFSSLDAGDTNIEFKNELFEGESLNVMNYSYFYNGGGVAIGDINNDGLQDILFTGNMVKNRLYLNKGNLEFENITEKAGIAEKQGWCTGATMVDINGDGKLDIYICRSADGDAARRKNLLFINNGNLTFTEKAEQYGLADQGYSTQAAFFDYDRDGDLDMFLINHSLQQYATGIQESTDIRNNKNPNFASKLYRNDNGHYSNVSEEAGITSNVLSFGLGIAISDVNRDGWPDMYVSNDFNEPDYLFINNGNGTFSEKLSECMDHISMYSMGSDFADYNNDGLTDLVTLDMLPEDNRTQKMHNGSENFDKMQMLFRKGFYYQYSRNMLQKNNGDGTFSEIGQLAGIANTDWSWSSLFADLDNDGNKDLFVSNGYVRDYTDLDFLKYTMDEAIKARNESKEVVASDFISHMPTTNIPNYLFQNKGDGRFEKKTVDWGMDKSGIASGAAYADLDNDGDLDLVINNTNEVASVYKNNAETLIGNHFVRIALKGDKANERGLGTRVTVHCGTRQYFQEQAPVRGFQSSVDPVLNFGLGKTATIDSVVVVWPNNKMQVLKSLAADKTYTVQLSSADREWTPSLPTSANTLFAEDSTLRFAHRENPFNDFTLQTLLPHYCSRPGPAMAKADVNNDGREDLYIGGARGQAGQLFIQDANTKFKSVAESAFQKDSLSEDVAAEFFDADGDGDADLFAGSGGYEVDAKDAALQDRLYINNGKGIFTSKPNTIPSKNFGTGVARAADIDGDGDKDLFVGGRVVPGKYPQTPESRILINDGHGNFSDGTASVFPALNTLGMVTDAIWTDLNNDHQPDLIVVGEWMPIKFFLNEKGRLRDASATYIKFASGGWWNTITAADMDADGDQDLILGNLGSNGQFTASEKEPVSIYFNDFDGNGSVDPVFCYYIDGVSYPAASRDDLTDQLPLQKKKFLRYSDYSTATISDLFSPEQLKEAKVLKAELLKTVYLQNNGAAGFEMKTLPDEAQYAPVHAIAVLDVNSDGNKDLVLAGNEIWTRIKFSRYDANHGVVLLGDGKGGFRYLPQTSSGLKIRGEVRGVELINGNQLIFGLNDSQAKTYRLRNGAELQKGKRR